MSTVAEKMPMRMISTRGSDRGLFQDLLPDAGGSEVLMSTVNENRLQKEIMVAPARGFEYMAALSRGRYTAQKEDLQAKEPGADYAIITSDTSLMVEKDGKYVAINGQTPAGEAQAYLDQINSTGVATLIGAVTFGRKQGDSMMTVLTYYDLPLAAPISAIPQDPHDLLALKDPGHYAEVGYIQPQAAPEGGLLFQKKPSAAVYPLNPGETVPTDERFVSGLTKDVLDLAEKSAVFDREVAPLMKREVSDHPFNTIAFYSGFQESGYETPGEYYENLVQNPQTHYDQFGGNCSLFVLTMEPQLREMGYETSVAVYSSDTPRHPEGHGAIIAKDQGIQYFIDPGLSFTYPIPISKDVPLFPVVFGGNKVVLLDVTYANNDETPDLIILKGDKKIILPGKSMTDINGFRKLIPRVLTELHDIRQKAKIDYHDCNGTKCGSVSIDRDTLEVDVLIGTAKLHVDLQDIMEDEYLHTEIVELFAQRGYDFAPVMTQLQGFAFGT